MNNDNISIQDRSKLFAIRAIKAYTELNKRQALESFDISRRNGGRLQPTMMQVKYWQNNSSEPVLALVQTLQKENLRSQEPTLYQNIL